MNFFRQGYETGRLIAVTPFVAKILEGGPSGNSRVFKPPNPWIMGIFSALHEVNFVWQCVQGPRFCQDLPYFVMRCKSFQGILCVCKFVVYRM